MSALLEAFRRCPLVPVLVGSDDLMAVNGLEGTTRPLVGQTLAPGVVGAVIGASVPAAGGYLIAGALGLALIAALPGIEFLSP